MQIPKSQKVVRNYFLFLDFGKVPPLPPVCSEDTVTGVMTRSPLSPTRMGGGGDTAHLLKNSKFQISKSPKGHPTVMTTKTIEQTFVMTRFF